MKGYLHISDGVNRLLEHLALLNGERPGDKEHRRVSLIDARDGTDGAPLLAETAASGIYTLSVGVVVTAIVASGRRWRKPWPATPATPT